MRKVPTLFMRNPEDRRYVTREVTPGCEWVLAGEGTATRKYDGTGCLVSRGRLFKRHEVKRGKNPPPYFSPADDVDAETGKQAGWVPVGSGPEDRWHREAFDADNPEILPDGTYELLGPKVQGNPEDEPVHRLIRHADAERYPAMNRPQGFDELTTVMATLPWEGIVWHHPDGRMAKLKRRDFPK